MALAAPTAHADGPEGFSKAKEYYKKGLYDLSLEELKKGLRKDPKDARAHLMMGLIYLAKEDPGMALVRLETAVELDFYLEGGQYALGIARKKLGLFEKATESFARAAKIEPDRAKVFFNWGVCLTRLKRYDEAAYAFGRAARLDRGKTASYFNLADVLRLSSRHREAVGAYDMVLVQKPKHADSHVGKGLCLEALGRPQEALLSFLSAVDCRPGDAKAYGFAAAMYRKVGEGDKADAYYAKYRKLSGASAYPSPDRFAAGNI